jgi:hypothetical protein
VVMTRFKALLDAIYPFLEQKVRYVSIGNEVDVYLRANPSEWQPYLVFYESVVAHAHGLDNSILVGVTATASGLLEGARQAMMDLNTYSDVVIATYYPLAADYTMQPPSQIDTDWPALITLADGKPLVFQEIGYAAASSLNSSEQTQADFVRHVFAVWRNSNGQVPLLNWFCLHDFSAAQLDTLKTYYGVDHENFFSYLATLGLCKADGTPRLAWQAILDQQS